MYFKPQQTSLLPISSNLAHDNYVNNHKVSAQCDTYQSDCIFPQGDNSITQQFTAFQKMLIRWLAYFRGFLKGTCAFPYMAYTQN